MFKHQFAIETSSEMHLFKHHSKEQASFRETPTQRETMQDTSTNRLTVLELFQSQGCSSCPPANKHVLNLTEDPNILALTYDVTYWDHLGWKDTFGKAEFDARQWAYARSLGKKNVYTPQVIVNGRVDGVGSTRGNLDSLLTGGQPVPGEPEVGVLLYQGLNGGFNVAINGPTNLTGTINLVRYDPATFEVPIARGENGGRTLAHRNVVREVVEVGSLQGGQREFNLPPLDDQERHLGTAILVQEGQGGAGRILGATRL